MHLHGPTGFADGFHGMLVSTWVEPTKGPLAVLTGSDCSQDTAHPSNAQPAAQLKAARSPGTSCKAWSELAGAGTPAPCSMSIVCAQLQGTCQDAVHTSGPATGEGDGEGQPSKQQTKQRCEQDKGRWEPWWPECSLMGSCS